MTPQTKSSLLWGLVGALAFLVLVQGYRLVAGSLRIGPVAVGGLALLVGAAAAGVTYVLEPRLNGRS
ncbi:hypothetical protein [Haloplanus natans]|uniref:hypothetical protein n=1 Tax=Haloplanus natans TaxID=376171 RepID=UPI0006780590|nr:hypothetical protein [Haloplanus natans]